MFITISKTSWYVGEQFGRILLAEDGVRESSSSEALCCVLRYEAKKHLAAVAIRHEYEKAYFGWLNTQEGCYAMASV